MPNAAAALLAMTLQRPITDTGVWLDKPPVPGTVVTAPLRLAGETQAPEGVLSVRLYAVRGTSVTELASYAPAVPLGTVRFAFTWTPDGPGTYTLRVVSTTAIRGFSADVPGLVVPSPATPPVRTVTRVTAAPRAASRPSPVARRAGVAREIDDSGRAFGRSAPTLPYARVVVRPAPVTRAAVAPVPLADDRSGWVSFAGGLLLLVVCSHLHRSLRPQPEPRGTA